MVDAFLSNLLKECNRFKRLGFPPSFWKFTELKINCGKSELVPLYTVLAAPLTMHKLSGFALQFSSVNYLGIQMTKDIKYFIHRMEIQQLND